MNTDLTAAHEALLQFLYRAPIGLVRTGLDGAVEIVNPMCAQLLVPLCASKGLDNLFDTLAPVAPQLRQLVQAFGDDSGTVVEGLRLGLDHGLVMGTQTLELGLLKLDPQTLMATLVDVSQSVRREQRSVARQVRAAERTDTMTRLPNRAAARDLIAELLPGAGDGFAVLFLNCDRFNQINDRLGDAAGDRVLGLVADRLRAVMRSRDRVGRIPAVDELAARIGGDEFVVVLDDLAQPDDVHAVAQRLVDTLAQPYGLDAEQVHLSISLGVVCHAQCASNADAVLRDASTAMVEAKRAGGGRYKVFEPRMRERAAQRAGLESELRMALGDGQLFVAYQPVVGLQADGSVDPCAGVEALVRWRHPTRGVVPPGEFIGLAEECGLICALGDFVLDSACHQFVKWQRLLGDAAPRLLSVNLSRAQLEQPDWAMAVDLLLQRCEMPASCLQLEVTESLAGQDEAMREALQQLKALGVTLALDDFGTGYSSLSSLHLLPMDVVKIDQSFVRQIDHSLHHQLLVEATVRISSSLGMATVAEGIETEAQLAQVRALGCNKGQGFLFSKPLLADELVRWLQQQRSPACA